MAETEVTEEVEAAEDLNVEPEPEVVRVELAEMVVLDRVTTSRSATVFENSSWRCAPEEFGDY